MSIFGDGYEERKAVPVWTGFVDYFPAAMAAVARVSQQGNDQHNPGQPLHWARGKSMNQWDTAMRHLIDARTAENPVPHLAQAAWRVMAALQLACEAAGVEKAPAAR